MNHYPLISLFQQQSSIQGQGTGLKYKLLSGGMNEVDVPLNTFTDFTDGLLAYINNSMTIYYSNRDSKEEDEEDTFNASEYGPIILEKINTYMIPIIVDINFEFSDMSGNSFYYDKFIYQCIFYLQDILLGCFQIPVSDGEINKSLMCFVLETDSWNDNGKQLVNVRFHFPYTRVNLEHLNRIVIPNFRRTLIDKNIIKNYVHQTPLNTDKLVPDMTEYVCMYGSKQSFGQAPFFLRNVYSYIDDANILDNDYPDESLLKFYVNYVTNPIIEPLDNSLIKTRYLDINAFEVTNKIYNLPLILSVHFYDKVIKIEENQSMTPIFEQQPAPKFANGSAYNEPTRIDKFQILAELLPMINKSRFTEYYKYDWLSIGKTIFNIYRGHPTGLTIFQHFTEDPVMKDECETVYNNFVSEILDIRTIKHYASIDSPQIYDLWLEKLYWDKLQPALSLNDLEIAKFACEILCLYFVYDRNNDQWFYFDGTRLVKDNKAFMLIDYISMIKDNPGNDKISKVLRKYRDTLTDQSKQHTDRHSQGWYEGLIKQVTALIGKLSNLAFVKKVVAALEVCMYDDNLYVKTDENLDIMACQDCVLECFGDTIINRPGKLQDYITRSTNICFPTTFTINHPKVQFMLRYYCQVHHDPMMRPGDMSQLCHWFLKHLASLLQGGNAEKFFINWIGEANASKSQVLKFLQAAFGDYCSIVPNHIITLNINANTGKPEPAVERAKGARAWVAAETDRSEKWHVGHVKKFTSGDDYENRTLHKEGGTRTASFQLIAMSNIDLDSPGADEAFFSRYIKVPFGSKWVDNAPTDIIEQYKQRRFPIDLSFSSKIKYYAQAQLWLMYYYFPIYKKEGIRVLPDIVKVVTSKYHRDLDVISNFIHDRLSQYWIGDPKDKIVDRNRKCALFDLHRLYRSWYRSAYGNEVQPLDQFKFRDEMVGRLKMEPDNFGFFYGITPREIQVGGSI